MAAGAQGRGLSLDRLRQCAACKAGEENICAAPRHLGITVDGGFATHVLVPHPRYLIDYAPLSPSFAGALMCSGLTAYAALKRLEDRAARGAAVAGRPRRRRHDGSCARARDVRQRAYVADIDAKKREAALAAGAQAAFDPADPGARKALLKAAAASTRRSISPAPTCRCNFATGVLAKGGKVVVTGLIGGGYATAGRHVPAQGHDHRGHANRHAWPKRAS